MKKLFLPLVMFILSSLSLAAQDEKSCYNQWAKAFEVRGATEVKDGWHEGVILSIRRGSKNECYTAKVQIEKGFVKDIFIKYVDGQYEPFLPSYKYAEVKSNITNGISKTMQTMDDELVNVIFINTLRPKKTAYERAPMPDIDDF